MPDRATIQRGMTLSLERKIQIGFGIAVAIIVAVGAAALRSTTATVESALWMAHTLEARRELEATFADLITAETAVRGFVITGDTTYLGPYHTARSTLGRLAAWSGAVVAVALAGIAGVLVSSELAGRRRAEQVVHETQARFRQMLASSTAVIYANTVAGGTFSPSWVSENITQITGYEVD